MILNQVSSATRCGAKSRRRRRPTVRVRSKGSARLVVISAVVASVFGPEVARAGGFTITMLGARRVGMTANLARPDDLSALFHNPAGLADQKGTRLHLSGAMTLVDSEFRVQALDATRFPSINPAGCGQGNAATCPWPVGPDGYYERAIRPESSFGVLPYLGASTDLAFLDESLRDLVVSLATYSPGFYGGTFRADAPTSYQMIGGYFALGAITGGFGYRVSSDFAIGGSLSLNYMRMSAAQRISIVNALTPTGSEPDFMARAAQGFLGDLRMDYLGIDTGLGWSLAGLYSPTPWLSIGLNYQGATAAQFEGDAKFQALGATEPGRLEALLGDFNYKLPTGLMIKMPIPHSIQAGVSVMPRPWIEVAVDYRLWLYNFYKRQTVTPRYAAGPGVEPFSEENLSRDKNYRLSWELAGGVLLRPWHRTLDLDLMFGGSFDQSPIPDESFTIDNPAPSAFTASTGVRWGITEQWRLATTYLAIIYLERDVRNSQASPPINARGTGLVHVPSFEVEYLF